MNDNYILIAAILTIITSLVHSILGELMIFQKKRISGSIVPRNLKSNKVEQWGIIWATWHIVSFFGLAIAATLFYISRMAQIESELIHFMINTISIAMFASSLLVLIGTKARHPGWIALLIVGGLLSFGGPP